MNKFLLTAAIAFAATAGALSISTSANAANLPWCATAVEGDASIDCSFQSRQQCEATVWGRGGQCEANAWSNAQARYNNVPPRYIDSYARYDMGYDGAADIEHQRP